jgi:multidrug efflux pump subunit AcrB
MPLAQDPWLPTAERGVIERALKNPQLVLVVLLATVVLGIASYQRLPADLLPVFKTPAVQIVTFYPGMPPEVMERDIMSRLERWTGQSVGIEHQEAKAMLGVSVVKDFFREGISLDTAMSQVTSYAVSDMFYLPPGTIPPMVMPFDPTASVPLCLVAVSSPTMNEKELYDIAYFELRNRLQSIQGVVAPAVYGGKLRRILAYVNREQLAARNLAPMDVVRALREQNVFIPAGNIKAGRTDYQIFANAMPEKVAELGEAPIAIRDGKPVLVRDVARVQDSAQIQTNVVRINGRRQVYVPIYRQPGANTIAVVDAIKHNLESMLQRLREMDPKAKHLALEVVLDQSVYVRDAVQGLQWAAGLGALLAALVVLVFLRSMRSTLVVVLAIPLSILASFVGLYFSGDTINAMTLGGLALAVGILVDQSIVVLENVVRHVRMGKAPPRAALDGTREVAAPIFVSTLTFVVVFYPVVFLSGMARFLFTPLALAASFAILFSYLISITLLPAYCARFLKTGQGPDHGATRETPGGLDRAPEQEATHGTRIERTEQAVAQIERLLIEELGQPDPEYPKVERHRDSRLRMVISNIGVLMDWPAAYTPNTGAMDAFILVQLKDGTDSFRIVSRLRQRLREVLPGVEIAFDTGGMLTAALNMGESAPIHLQVSGSNLSTAHDIAQSIANEVRAVAGAEDVRIAQRLDYPAIKVEIDRIKAAYAGITVEDVMKNLVTATNSSVNFDPAFWLDPKNGNHYFIGVQYPESDLLSLDTLRDIPITGKRSKAPVLLRTIATFSRTTGPAVINHRDITRVIDVYANVAPGHDAGSVVGRIERRLARSKELAPTGGV